MFNQSVTPSRRRRRNCYVPGLDQSNKTAVFAALARLCSVEEVSSSGKLRNNFAGRKEVMKSVSHPPFLQFTRGGGGRGRGRPSYSDNPSRPLLSSPISGMTKRFVGRKILYRAV